MSIHTMIEMQCPKDRTWESKKYREWICKQESAAPCGKERPFGDIVPCHQNLGYGKGGGKVSDSQILPLYFAEHTSGNGSEHGGHKSFWGDMDRAKLCLDYLCRYLDEKHNIDAYRLALNLLTQHVINKRIK